MAIADRRAGAHPAAWRPWFTVIAAAVLTFALTPPADLAWAATRVDLAGRVRVAIADDLRSRHEEIAWLETTSGVVSLAFPTGVDLPPDGTAIRVTGLRAPNGTVSVDGATITAPARLSAASPLASPTAPTRSILVIIASFSDVAGDPATPDQATATFTTDPGSTHAFYDATSRGRVSTTATIAGPWPLGIASTCDPGAVWTAGDALATAHGYDPGAYDHVVVWTVQPSCAWWAGMGTLGGSYVWFSYGFSGYPDEVPGMAAIVTHEIGHNLGLHHATAFACFDMSDAQVVLGGTCDAIEYGDPYSVMGNAHWFNALLDSDELGDLGWLDAGESRDITSVGTYTLASTYAATSGARLLRIPRTGLTATDGPGYWRLETRGSLTGVFDRFDLGGPAVSPGVLVRFAEPGPPGYAGINRSALIDAVPDGSRWSGTHFDDAPFTAGQTFTDVVGGLTIHVDSVSASGATVTIGDTAAPSAPGSITPTVGGMSVGLVWSTAVDNLGLGGYVIRRDGVEVATVSKAALSWTDTSVAPGASYAYQVLPFDTAGLVGPAASVEVTTPSVPSAPTGVTGAPGNAQALIAWSVPASSGGSPITGYTATSSPDGHTCATTGTLSCVVTGLSNGTPYTFSVTAHSGVGTGPASDPSAPVTPRTVPGPPSGVTATAGARRAAVSWSAPASDGGSPIIGYLATASPGGSTCLAAGSLTCAITGLADGVYTVTVTATNPAGTGPASASSASFRIDATRPTATMPRSSFTTGAQLGATTVPVRLTWTGADTGSGVDHFELAQSTNGGAYVKVATPVTTSATRTLKPSSTTTYRFRVRAIDRAGNVSTWATGPTFKVLRAQQSSIAVRYRGTWATVSASSASGGSYRYAGATGASASYTFTGRSIAWVATQGASFGKARVYLDGVYKATIDLRASATAWRRIVYTRAWSSSGTHTIRIVCLATAGHPRVSVDAFVVLK